MSVFEHRNPDYLYHLCQYLNIIVNPDYLHAPNIASLPRILRFRDVIRDVSISTALGTTWVVTSANLEKNRVSEVAKIHFHAFVPLNEPFQN